MYAVGLPRRGETGVGSSVTVETGGTGCGTSGYWRMITTGVASFASIVVGIWYPRSRGHSGHVVVFVVVIGIVLAISLDERCIPLFEILAELSDTLP